MTPERPAIVVAGAGVGGLELVLALHELAADRVDITLLAPEADYTEAAMTIAEAFGRCSRVRRPVASIVAGTGAEVVGEALAAVDPAAHTVRTASGTIRRYDHLVLAVGAVATPVAPGVPTVGPQDVAALRGLAGEVASGAAVRVGIVIPTGRHWSLPAYELALLLADRGRAAGRTPQITVIAPEPEPLSIFGADAARELREQLDAHGVELLRRASAEIRPGPPPVVVLHPGGTTIELDRVVALPRLAPRPISGLGAPAGAFLRVDALGRVDGVPDVYAIGDATDGPIKLGSLAAQEAETVARHLAVLAGATAPPAPVRPGPQATLHTPGATRPLPIGRGPDPEPAIKVAAPRLARRLAADRPC